LVAFGEEKKDTKRKRRRGFGCKRRFRRKESESKNSIKRAENHEKVYIKLRVGPLSPKIPDLHDIKLEDVEDERKCVELEESAEMVTGDVEDLLWDAETCVDDRETEGAK
jgi:hypothetical protein